MTSLRPLRRIRRDMAACLAVAVAATSAAVAPAAPAGASPLDGCTTRLGGMPTNPLLQYRCSSPGDSAPGAAAQASPYRYVDAPAGGACHVIDGVGYEGDDGSGGTWVWETVYDASSWAVARGPYRACLLPQGSGDGARTHGSIPIPQPTIQTDWDHQGPNGPLPLLTGAPVQFRMDSPTHLDKDVDFDGTTQSMALDATSMTWDFGDGTISHEAAPVHTFESKGPDRGDPADHAVHVTLSVTWSATAAVNGQATKEIGVRTVTAAFDRTIEEVWAAQMEPSPHV